MIQIVVYSASIALAAAAVGGAIAVGLRRRVVPEKEFFDQVRDAALITEGGAIRAANRAASEQFGYAADEMIGLPVTTLLADPADETHFLAALLNGPVSDFPLRLRRKDGEIRDCAITARARFDARGRVIGCSGLARDVTDQNRTMAELRRAEHDYRGLFDNAYDAILILDRIDETVLDVNHRACVLYRLSRENFVGRSMVELSVDPLRGASLLQQTREGAGRYGAFESRQYRGDGSVMDVEINATEIVYQGRKVILSINRDISARREAERAIRDSEARFRLLLENVTDYAIVMLDAEGNIASWNEGAQRITGYAEDEVVGRNMSLFAPPDETAGLFHDLAAARASERHVQETVCVRKDGTSFAASATLTRIMDEDTLCGFALVLHDISERVQVERARQELIPVLERVATEWVETFDAVQAPMLLLDRRGKILRLNRAARILAQRPFSDLSHHSIEELHGEPWQTIARLSNDSVRSGSSWSVRVTTAEAVWQVSSCAAGSGDDRRAIVAAYDLTLVTRLEASVRQNEVAAAMGTMVAAVAHEVRNPLFTISAIVDAWCARFSDHDGVARYSAPLREQVLRLNRLMVDLLEYGRPHPLERHPASLEDAIRAAAKDCSAAAAQFSASIEVDVDPELPFAVIDLHRIEQVFQNVIDNAIRHTRPGGVVHVAATLGKGQLVIRITDEGPGVPVQDLERVFQPFYSRRGGGTGLGLAIARGIVTAHGGDISIRNRDAGEGAVVTIRLPLPAETNGSEMDAQAEAH